MAGWSWVYFVQFVFSSFLPHRSLSPSSCRLRKEITFLLRCDERDAFRRSSNGKFSDTRPWLGDDFLLLSARFPIKLLFSVQLQICQLMRHIMKLSRVIELLDLQSALSRRSKRRVKTLPCIIHTRETRAHFGSGYKSRWRSERFFSSKPAKSQCWHSSKALFSRERWKFPRHKTSSLFA